MQWRITHVPLHHLLNCPLQATQVAFSPTDPTAPQLPPLPLLLSIIFWTALRKQNKTLKTSARTTACSVQCLLRMLHSEIVWLTILLSDGISSQGNLLELGGVVTV